MERPRAASPERMKAARTALNIAADFSAAAPRPHSPQHNELALLRPNSVHGRNSDERIRLRALQTYQSEHQFESSAELYDFSGPASRASTIRPASQQQQRSPSRSSSRTGTAESRASSSGGRRGAASPQQQQRNVLTDPLLAQHRIERTPDARLNYENPIAGNTKILGSSQIIGCQGDFCSFDMTYLENTETLPMDVTKGGAKNANDLSDFRKRLLTTGAGSNFVDASSSVSKLLSSSSGAHDPRKQSLSSVASAAASTAAAVADQKITYRSIIQARQELPLVKSALENHRKGVKNIPYLHDDSFTDLAASLSMAAHFYQEVPCCLNCYKVYTIVDKERRKALNRVAEKRQRGERGSLDEAATNSLLVQQPLLSPTAAGAGSSTAGKHNQLRSLPTAAAAGTAPLLNTQSAADAASRDFLQNELTNFQTEALMNLGSSSKGRRNRRNPAAAASTSVSAATTAATTSVGAMEDASLAMAQRAVAELTKADVAEIRTMSHPHPAVAVVMEAVLALLTGRKMSFKEAQQRLLGGGGDAFLALLRDFTAADVSDERLLLVQGYVDHPVFKPEYVLPISRCASKFCAWVHGMTHAARHARGLTHPRVDAFGRTVAVPPLQQQQQQQELPRRKDVTSAATAAGSAYLKPLRRMQTRDRHFNRGDNFIEQGATVDVGDSFVQKIDKIRAHKFAEFPQSHTISRQPHDSSGSAPFSAAAASGSGQPQSLWSSISRADGVDKKWNSLSSNSSSQLPLAADSSLLSRSTSRFDPRPAPSAVNAAAFTGSSSSGGGRSSPAKKAKLSKRESKAMLAMQQKATNRLSAQTAAEGGGGGLLGSAATFRCADGVTKMPYAVLGKFSLPQQSATAGAGAISRCNFVVVHDFFDTCDATAILFKPIVARHDGCQVLVFNYPGQAHTVWPRTAAAVAATEEAATAGVVGGRLPILNNDFIADRLHELLQHAERGGELLLTNPFHLVGIGNGATIAAAFCQKYARSALYARGLRSLVAVNGFLHPDPQLSAVLHSAFQVFESAPHSRPDIPVSYWSRFVFSDEYLGRINPNLALNIYTAVSNPITNEGRAKIARGALQHRDMRGALSPDFHRSSSSTVDQQQRLPLQVPVILLQSTENTLVNASNVDAFLTGRSAKHLWSHMLNVPSEAARNGAFVDVTAQWVGKMSSGPHDYHKYSTLGKAGLKILLECLRNPRGAFAMWTRTGHVVQQEYKGAVLDLFDALACPTDEYIGLQSIEASEEERRQALLALTKSQQLEDERQQQQQERVDAEKKLQLLAREVEPPAVDVIFSMPGAGATSSAGSSAESTAAATVEGNDGEFDVLSLIEAESRKSKPKRPQQSATEATAEEEDVVALDPNLLQLMDNISYVKQRIDTDDNNNSSSDEYSDDDNGMDAARLEHRRKIRRAAEQSQSSNSNESSSNSNSNSGISPAPKKQRQGSRPNSGASRTKSHLTAAVAAAAVTNAGSESDDSTAVVAAAVKNGPTALTDLYAMQPPELPPFDSKKQRGLEEQQLSTTATPTAVAIVDTDVVDIDIDKDDRSGSKVVKGMKEGLSTTYISDTQQRRGKQWTKGAVPDAVTALELEAQLREKQQEFLQLEQRLQRMRAEEQQQRSDRVDDAQEKRRQQYAEEDQKLLSQLQSELDERQRERDFAEKQRRLDVQRVEEALLQHGIIDSEMLTATGPAPVPEMNPLRYEQPTDLPQAVSEGQDVLSKLDRMKADEEAARKRGSMTMEEFERVKREMAERQLERDQMLRSLSKEEQQALFEACAIRIQRIGRGYNGRKKATAAAALKRLSQLKATAAVRVQSQMRRVLAKKRFDRIRDIFLNNMKYAHSAAQIQRVFRGHQDRRYFRRLKRWVSAIHVQRCFRGFIGRQAYKREQARLELLRRKQLSAAKIQSVWRMKIAKEEFRSLRIHVLAAIEVQRCLRGYLGRKVVTRRRLWESTTPGPERIKLGLEFIEESKQAFERQQEEIDALHRAQERAESRVSHIHSELSESEKELLVLERELQEIDQIERDLSALTQERELLSSGIHDAAGMPRLAGKGRQELVLGRESTSENDPVADRRRKAEAYALEMTIQIKRAEREKKRQELEIEFAAVFQEVQKKKKALERLELSLADMEATRERKEREFRRLQKNLMQLLMEQKQELDELREKGIELETASATTAAAAVATAQKAKEHEARSTAMFSQTEELMKFQFMSMSLSYFSSLNMLKSLRDMNADTTSAAISLSADAAATAASSAAAANLPNMRKMDLGAGDFVEASIQKKKAELQASKKAEEEFNDATAHPMPDNVRAWTTADVARWLDSLALSQYCPAFTEAAVDGPFLMELREEDLVQVLGMKHKLHVRKVMISREKLKPLSQQEQKMKDAVEVEDRADTLRNEIGAPSLDTVFSQARNGRVKRVEESLNLGFPIDAEDEKGNTLLLVASQNSNRRLVEMLLARGADINHQNAQGSTALHFALTFDSEGTLGEYLIEHGADDTIENVEGLTPYDGISAS